MNIKFHLYIEILINDPGAGAALPGGGAQDSSVTQCSLSQC
jgi:hypothetical protein